MKDCYQRKIGELVRASKLLMTGFCALTVASSIVARAAIANRSATIAQAPVESATAAARTASESTVGDSALALVATFSGAMPTGVTVSQEGRIFVTFPRWGDEVPFTVAEVIETGGRREAIAYPNLDINQLEGPAAERFVSAQSVVVAPNNQLWVLDAARIEFGEPPEGGPKLVGIDLSTNEVVQTIVLPPDVALPTSYLNDVRFDLTRGDAGFAYITDSSPSGDNGLIVVDLASGESWRKLDRQVSTLPEPDFVPIVEGQPLLNRPANGEPSNMTIGMDGIALSAAGDRLFYRPLSGRRLYSVGLDEVSDRKLSDEKAIATIEDHGDLGFASDGLEADAAGRVYLTNYEDNGIVVRQPDGSLETLLHSPNALWPDTLSLASDGYLYFISNQLHRQPSFHRGEDLRVQPYGLYRIQVDAAPVLLE